MLKFIAETLRKYPAGPLILRKSVSSYTFNNTKVSIPEKTFVWIPLYAIHHNPDIYPNPDAFIPERFNDDAVASRDSMHYLPFGDGPRNCIGTFLTILSDSYIFLMLQRYYINFKKYCDIFNDILNIFQAPDLQFINPKLV